MEFDQMAPAERERLLNKLGRLKALSQCKTGNPNETATAAAAMTRLMLEYKIEMAELEPRPASGAQRTANKKPAVSISWAALRTWTTRASSSPTACKKSSDCASAGSQAGANDSKTTSVSA